jgi:hypothetical protein
MKALRGNLFYASLLSSGDYQQLMALFVLGQHNPNLWLSSYGLLSVSLYLKFSASFPDKDISN